MLKGLLKHFPQLQGYIEYVEMASPLSNRHYLNRAASYGLQHPPSRYTVAGRTKKPAFQSTLSLLICSYDMLQYVTIIVTCSHSIISWTFMNCMSMISSSFDLIIFSQLPWPVASRSSRVSAPAVWRAWRACGSPAKTWRPTASPGLWWAAWSRRMASWATASWTWRCVVESLGPRARRALGFGGYPLVMTNITMENHHFQWENPL